MAKPIPNGANRKKDRFQLGDVLECKFNFRTANHPWRSHRVARIHLPTHYWLANRSGPLLIDKFERLPVSTQSASNGPPVVRKQFRIVIVVHYLSRTKWTDSSFNFLFFKVVELCPIFQIIDRITEAPVSKRQFESPLRGQPFALLPPISNASNLLWLTATYSYPT